MTDQTNETDRSTRTLEKGVQRDVTKAMSYGDYM